MPEHPILHGIPLGCISDVFGEVKERFAYDPYGNFAVLDSAYSGTSDAFSWVTLHQGKRFDAATGLYQFNFREYSPTLATFLQADPIGYPDGMNRYQFVFSK